jgi:uncharacterized protein YodC (DUF2158 family)
MDNKFKVGDVVQLKSGGPLMTIASIGIASSQEQLASCIWFEGSKKNNGNFLASVLMAMPSEPPQAQPYDPEE